MGLELELDGVPAFGSTAGGHIKACSLDIEVVAEFGMAESCSEIDVIAVLVGKK